MNQLRKILVVSPFFYPHIGGSERYMEDLYAYIKQKNPQIQIDVLCYNSNKVLKRQLYKGLNIYRIGCYTILPDQFLLPNIKDLYNFLSTHKDYDLVHANTRFFDSSVWAPIFTKLIRAKIVLTDHCAAHPVSSNVIAELIAKLVDLTFVFISIHFYDKVFVQNKKTGRFLKKTFGVNSHLAYPGVSVSWSNKSKSNPTVLFVGRMISSKGVETLLDIARKMPKINFIFAGDGPLLSTFRKNKTKNIKFLGAQTPKQVQKLMAKAAIFAYPSTHSEGLPMAILEAGAAGLSIVAYDSGAIPEVIENGKTGMLVKAGDRVEFEKALARLIKDPNLRNRLGSSLQKFITKNFNWEKAANLILKELK